MVESTSRIKNFFEVIAIKGVGKVKPRWRRER